MRKLTIVLIPCFLLFLTSCQKYYLHVHNETVNVNSLASTFVQSPDPLQKDPPVGRRLILEWKLPKNAIEEALSLDLRIIYKNYEEETLHFAIDRKRGVVFFPLLGEEYKKKKGFLTYRAEIKNKDGKILDEWKQQMWIDLIRIDKEDVFDEFPKSCYEP